MRISVSLEPSELKKLKSVTGIDKMSPAVELAVREFIRSSNRKEFADKIRRGFFDFPCSNDELEKSDR